MTEPIIFGNSGTNRYFTLESFQEFIHSHPDITIIKSNPVYLTNYIEYRQSSGLGYGKRIRDVDPNRHYLPSPNFRSVWWEIDYAIPADQITASTRFGKLLAVMTDLRPAPPPEASAHSQNRLVDLLSECLAELQFISNKLDR